VIPTIRGTKKRTREQTLVLIYINFSKIRC